MTSTKIGGKDYFQIIYNMHNDDYGIPLDVKCTMMAHIEDGYASLFLFTQAPSGGFFNEFKTLLESVEFHYPIEEKTAETSKESTATESNQGASAPDSVDASNHYPFLLLLIIPVAIIAFIVIKKHKEKTKSFPRNDSNQEPINASSHTEESQNAILFCHKCGARLSADESVCKCCGSIIPR